MAEPSEYTILRSHPRWGVTTGCFDSRSQTVAPGAADPVGAGRAVYRAFQPNRVMTDADKKEIAERIGGVELLLNQYSDAVIAAEAKWRSINDDVLAVESRCGSGGSCRISGLGALQDTLTEGNLAFDEISRKRIRAFTECDFLMVNAPDAIVAQKICQQKIECFNAQTKAFDKMTLYVRKLGDARADAFRLRDDELNGMLAFFKMLLDAIKGLIAIIQAGFQAFLQAAGVALQALSWFGKHPSALLWAGGAVGLLVLAFVLRPYIGIAKFALGKKKRKRLLRKA